MLRYKRPAAPESFDESVRPLKEEVGRLVAAAQRRARAAGKVSKSAAKVAAAEEAAKKAAKKAAAKAAKEKISFKNAWKWYKGVYSEVQFGKCGFCESDVTKTGFGDVEHYRPKGEVWEFTQEGRRRVRRVLCAFGYWWLAYDWSNYLFACARCNQKFKGSYFPVKESERRLPPNPKPSRKFPSETPLLLNPYDTADDLYPLKHLKFTRAGVVLARDGSPFGDATIHTLGLHRAELLRARAERAMRAFELLAELRRAGSRTDASLVRHCYRLGRDDREHAGMVRYIFEESLGKGWGELVGGWAAAVCRQRAAAGRGAAAEELGELIEEMGRERYAHSDVVRQTYETVCGGAWAELVRARARVMAGDLKDFLDGGDDGGAVSVFVELREMARDTPSLAGNIKAIVEAQSGAAWNDLELSLGELEAE